MQSKYLRNTPVLFPQTAKQVRTSTRFSLSLCYLGKGLEVLHDTRLLSRIREFWEMLLTTCMLGECCSSCFSRRSLVGKEAPHCAHWSGVIWSGEHWSAPGPGTAPATGDEDAGRAGGGGCGGAASKGAVGADGCGDAAGGATGGGEDVGVEAAPWTVVMWSRSAEKPALSLIHI